MNLFARIRAAWRNMTAPTVGDTLADRLDSYYRPQADIYDAHRPLLLHGRPILMRDIPIRDGDRVVDFGAGTGANVEALGERRQRCRSITLVDLCEPLLAVARQRIARNHWENVRIERADATTFEPVDGPADVVLFSYSLTMIPDWFRAVDQAYRILKPGGHVGVADFYVSQAYPSAGLRRHAAWQRLLWPTCFRGHNVFVSPDHLPYLRSRFETVSLHEGFGSMPFMFGLQPPFYVFVGRRP